MRRPAALLAVGLVLLLGAAVRADTPGESSAPGVVARIAAATEAFRAATAAPGSAASEERAAGFRRAAELYRAALAGGPRNGALEYNAANAWLLAGDVGRAIVHYRRALDVRPGDPRIEANLDTARTRRRDQFEETSSRALIDTLLFWHHRLTLRTKIPIALSTWTLGFALLAMGVWLERGRAARARTLRLAAAALVVAVAIGGSALLELRDRARRDAAVIVADEVEMRTGDGASYPARYENPVHSGAEVRVVEERAGWVHVELPDDKRGWVPTAAVERV